MNIKYIVSTTSLIVGLSLLPQAANASVEDALSNICNIVKADDKGELRKKMKVVQTKFSMRLKDYYDGITCDGNSLIRTALLSQANEAGSLLVKKLPKSKLGAPENDGVALIAWIESNGLTASPIASAVSERI